MADNHMKDTLGTIIGIFFLTIVSIFAGVLIAGASSAWCIFGLGEGCSTVERRASPAPTKPLAEKQNPDDIKAGGDASQKNFRDVSFKNRDLSRANFSEADLREADFRNAILLETIFWAADLRKADFRKANLSGADFTEANLRGADFKGANLSEADFSENNSVRRTNLGDAWAWDDLAPLGLPGGVGPRLCSADQRDDHEASNRKGRPKRC